MSTHIDYHELKMEKLLVDKDYVLMKVGDKCAWTFAEIAEIPMPKKSFGMLKVKGKSTIMNSQTLILCPWATGM